MTRFLLAGFLLLSCTFNSLGQTYTYASDSLAIARLGYTDTTIQFNPHLAVRFNFVPAEIALPTLENHGLKFQRDALNPNFQNRFFAQHPGLDIDVQDRQVRVGNVVIPHPGRNWYPSSRIDTSYEQIDVMRIRWGWDEGGGFGLVKYLTGQSVFMYGEPHLSPKGNFVVAVNCDLDAGYTPTGFEFYSVFEDFIDKHPAYSTLNWGPVDFVWQFDTRGYALCKMIDPTTEHWDELYFFLLLTIDRTP
ncbi:MAG: hypothetical protein HWD92_03560 [Flavobacteriia bacterium]|nr:hypothetical protein [Flavobacteriia bacterium]